MSVPIMSRVATPRHIVVGKNVYDFRVQHNVSLAWVEDQDVQAVLKIKGGCCNHQNSLFRLANERVVKVWTEGHY